MLFAEEGKGTSIKSEEQQKERGDCKRGCETILWLNTRDRGSNSKVRRGKKEGNQENTLRFQESLLCVKKLRGREGVCEDPSPPATVHERTSRDQLHAAPTPGERITTAPMPQFTCAHVGGRRARTQKKAGTLAHRDLQAMNHGEP